MVPSVSEGREGWCVWWVEAGGDQSTRTGLMGTTPDIVLNLLCSDIQTCSGLGCIHVLSIWVWTFILFKRSLNELAGQKPGEEKKRKTAFAGLFSAVCRCTCIVFARVLKSRFSDAQSCQYGCALYSCAFSL